MQEMDWEAFHAETEQKIQENGWTVITVGDSECACSACKNSGSDGTESTPFAYTVGLHECGLPEVLMFGLPPQVMGGICGDVANRLLSEPDMELADGLLLEQVIRGFAVKVRLLGRIAEFADRDEVDHFGYLGRYATYKGHDLGQIEAIEVLWPDPDGAFPDEDSCTLPKIAQPLLQGARST